MITEKLKRELKYIHSNYDFSKSCTEEMREEITNKGLVEFVEGSIMLTAFGEKAIGVNVDELYGDTEEDITEAFYYMNEGEYDETF